MSEKHKRKIAVVGAGAVGSLVGGLLARAGEDVTLIGRHDHVQAIRENGLRVDGALGTLTIAVKVVEKLDFKADIVLLGVKTQDVEAACSPIKALMRDAVIVTLQNGVRSDDIVASLFAKENIISGVVMFNAQYLQPGHVSYARAGALLIGEAFGQTSQRTTDMLHLLNRAIRTRITSNIGGAHWAKLLVNNLANGLEAMTGLPIRECMRQPGLRRISVMALKEGARAVEAAGIRLEPLPGVLAPALPMIIRLPASLSSWVIGRSLGTLRTLSSTLQSLRRGRPTEIDFLNGEISRLGAKIGMETPYNSTIVNLVKEVEVNGRFLSSEQIIRRFPRP